MKWIALGVCVHRFVYRTSRGKPCAAPAHVVLTIAPGVSAYGFVPLGGGICLGNRRVTDPAADGGIAWSPDGRASRSTGDGNYDGRRVPRPGGRRPASQPDPRQRRVQLGARLVARRQPNRLRRVRPALRAARHRAPRRVRSSPVPGTAVDPAVSSRDPRWSPDGSVIGYTLTDGIHVIRPDGSPIGRLLLRNAAGFDWSPDGRRIVFTLDRDLAVANSDGNRTPLLHGRRSCTKAARSGLRTDPGCSTSLDEPDPKVERAPRDDMYLADANGRNRRELQRPPGVRSRSPSWRPPASARSGGGAVRFSAPELDVPGGTRRKPI